jgi:LysR family glycine cleavage system transcriptional activator
MPNTSKASLRGLRTFCVAAKHESFRIAGEASFITSSAVSHQIKGLEQELDQQLFDRNSRELKLTETGRALYDDINPLIEHESVFRNWGLVYKVPIPQADFFSSQR